jgi:transposase-like protein
MINDEKQYARRGNPIFTEEKQEAVALDYLQNPKKRLREVAHDFNCSITLAHKFIKQYKEKHNIN